MSLEIGSSIVNMDTSITYAEWLGNEMKKKNCRYEILISKHLNLFELEKFKVDVIKSSRCLKYKGVFIKRSIGNDEEQKETN